MLRMTFDQQSFEPNESGCLGAQLFTDGQLQRTLTIVQELPKLIDPMRRPSEEFVPRNPGKPLSNVARNRAQRPSQPQPRLIEFVTDVAPIRCNNLRCF